MKLLESKKLHWSQKKGFKIDFVQYLTSSQNWLLLLPLSWIEYFSLLFTGVPKSLDLMILLQ